MLHCNAELQIALGGVWLTREVKGQLPRLRDGEREEGGRIGPESFLMQI